jgi:hypothetical protein
MGSEDFCMLQRRIVKANFVKPEVELDAKTRAVLMTIRRALSMVLGALEDYIGVERSVNRK